MRNKPDRLPFATGFAAFLPADYQKGFSAEWLMGLSPFGDRPCATCYSVREGQWDKAEERSYGAAIAGGRSSDLQEYAADYCLESLFCPKRFVFRQRMSDPPVATCPTCRVPLTRVLSSFSAGIGLAVRSAAAFDPPAGSLSPPETIKNMFGGGLGIRGCGHDQTREGHG
jgi:hypothetical protein